MSNKLKVLILSIIILILAFAGIYYFTSNNTSNNEEYVFEPVKAEDVRDKNTSKGKGKGGGSTHWRSGGKVISILKKINERNWVKTQFSFLCFDAWDKYAVYAGC